MLGDELRIDVYACRSTVWKIGFTAMLHLARVSNNCIDEKAHQVYALAFDPLRLPIADGAVAPVVELADTQDSGSCAGDGVEVRILSGAHQLFVRLRSTRRTTTREGALCSGLRVRRVMDDNRCSVVPQLPCLLHQQNSVPPQISVLMSRAVRVYGSGRFL